MQSSENKSLLAVAFLIVIALAVAILNFGLVRERINLDYFKPWKSLSQGIGSCLKAAKPITGIDDQFIFVDCINIAATHEVKNVLAYPSRYSNPCSFESTPYWQIVKNDKIYCVGAKY